jgi:uncharacterized phage protein gp47/JayE
MTTLPDYLTDQTEPAIRQRMLASVSDDIDKNEGSYVWDAIAPVAIELKKWCLEAQEVLRRSFAETTFGAYLDLRCAEHGVTRRAAVGATVTLQFSGTAGTVIPAGSLAATPADDQTSTPSINFTTLADVTIAADGKGNVDAQATEGGSKTNVAAGTITVLPVAISGVSGVTNPAPTNNDGLDVEDDATLLSRFLFRVQNPITSGNKNHYIVWAMEVAGVGAVAVVPVRDGPGTVSVAIVDTAKAAPSKTLIDSVQNYIAPPWVVPIPAESMTAANANGVTTDTTQTDDTGSSRKLEYSASGEGRLEQVLTGDYALQRPGIWEARARVKVDDITRTTDLLTLSAYNNTTAALCKTVKDGSTDAVATFHADDFLTTFKDYAVQFYWNGADELKLIVERQNTDTATVVWVDQVRAISKFSMDTGEGKAPVGASVTVEGATTVAINVAATITYASGYEKAEVDAAVEAKIEAYLKGLVFAADNDVRYVRIGQQFLDTPGIYDFANLTVNSGTANITIGQQQIAVKGTVSLT